MSLSSETTVTKVRRAQSVFTPNKDYAARNDIEEAEQIRLAMSLSLQDAPASPKGSSQSDIGRPTLLESALKANSVSAFCRK